MTFIKRADKVECIKSTSLPIGVVSNLELEKQEASQGLWELDQSPTFGWEVGTMLALKPYLAKKIGLYAWG